MRAASAICLPFIPPGKPMSVTSKSIELAVETRASLQGHRAQQ
jgi:hypothetical protein